MLSMLIFTFPFSFSLRSIYYLHKFIFSTTLSRHLCLVYSLSRSSWFSSYFLSYLHILYLLPPSPSTFSFFLHLRNSCQFHQFLRERPFCFFFSPLFSHFIRNVWNRMDSSFHRYQSKTIGNRNANRFVNELCPARINEWRRIKAD